MSVVGNAITVSPATGATNTDVVTAIQGSVPASALVTVVATGDSDTVTAFSTTNLSGGTNLPTKLLSVASIISSTQFAVSDPALVGGFYEYYNASAYTTAAGSTVTQPVQSIFNESSLDTTFTDMSSTPGNVTITTQSGAAAFATGTKTIVVTNPLITLNSVIIPVLQQVDATLTQVLNVVPANGSFTINANANATAPTKVGFQCFNVLSS